MLDPLERFSIEAIRAAQALGEQPQPLRALLVAQCRLLGRRSSARGGTRHISSLSPDAAGSSLTPSRPPQETRIISAPWWAAFPSDAPTVADLYRVADEALYAAKKAGRSRVLGAVGSATPGLTAIGAVPMHGWF